METNLHLLLIELAWIGVFFLKLLGVIAISWKAVFMPLIIALGVLGVFIVLGLLLASAGGED